MATISEKRSLDDGRISADSKRSRFEPSPMDTTASDGALDFSKGKVHTTNKVRVKEEEKENYTVDDLNGPIDLTKKALSPDVITLSDSDDDHGTKNGGLVNGESASERKHVIKRLKEELRNEEAKLVLLKKLRHSQRTNHPAPEPTAVNSNKAHMGSRPANVSAPPPLVRGSGQSTLKPVTTSSINPMSVLRTPAHSQQSIRQSQQQSHPPPPLVMAPAAIRSGQVMSQNMQRASGQSQSSLLAGFSARSLQQSQANSQPSAMDSQTPAQRQAAAKLALRKQLEKTLLQIPPPKPPPPEMNFIPSLASNEFIMLAGLEEVVKTIMDLDSAARGKAQDVKYVFNPFTCVQCGTDFTPVWKRDKPGSKNVICEACVTSNQKKALKQEHTNRLKSAFVKALQQEQEIEQRMQAQPVSTTNTPSQSTSISNPVNLSSGGYKSSKSASVTPQMSHQNLLQAHAVVQQLHNPQAAAAAVALGLPGFNPRLAGFPFSFTKPGDIPRQFLLDMIPPRGLHPGAMPWKS